MNTLSHIKASEKGVSMMEIVATVCLIGILLKVAIPSFSAITQAQNKRAGRESFETFLKRAQATAIKNGARVVLTSRNGGTFYTFGVDYTPYNSPVNPDSTTLRLNLPKNITVTTSARIVFDSRGKLIDSAGLPTSSLITMGSTGSTFTTGTLYSTGALIYN